MILRDVIDAGLRVVFCGIAAGTTSAEVGAYYAGPGNAFWATLHQVGLTPRELRPSEYLELLSYGLGLTDICKLKYGSDREVGTGGFQIDVLIAKLEQFAPDWIAFNGKNAAKGALGRAVNYGEQPERLGTGSRLRASLDFSRRARILGLAILATALEHRRILSVTLRFTEGPGGFHNSYACATREEGRR